MEPLSPLHSCVPKVSDSGDSELTIPISLLPGEDQLGLVLIEEENSLRVKSICLGTAASRSGLRCEDQLTGVNAVPLYDTPLSDALTILQEAMTANQFALKVQRPSGGDSLERDQSLVQDHSESEGSTAHDGLQLMKSDKSDVLMSANGFVAKGQATTMPNVKSSRPLSAPSKQYSVVTSKSHTLPAKSSSATVFSRDSQILQDKQLTENHSQVSIGVEDASTPLNLRHISMDETRIASIFHMDSIWRQVESGDDSPAVSRHFMPEPEADASPDHHASIVASHVQEGSISDKFVDDAWSTSPQHKLPTPTATPHSTLVTSTPVKAHSLILDSSPPKVNNADVSEVKGSPLSNRKGIDSLLTTLKSLGKAEEKDNSELQLLEDFLHSTSFQKAKKVHDTMHHLLSGVPKPAQRRILPSYRKLRELLHSTSHQSELLEELSSLLRNSHIQALLFSHDKVSTHDLYVPDSNFHEAAQDPTDVIISGSVPRLDTAVQGYNPLLPLSRDLPSGRKEGAVIVFIERTNKPLGVTLYQHEGSVFIGSLLKGCDADMSDVLKEGDELLEVNGMPVASKSTEYLVLLMSQSNENSKVLVLTIIPVHDDGIDLEYETKFVRAHFSYNGQLDEDIPCKAVGMLFQKGDILEVSNQDNPEWWQARKMFDDGAESLPGLIPSRHLQQQREAMIQSYSRTPESRSRKGIFPKKRKKRVFYENVSKESGVCVGDEVPTYEEVVRLSPTQAPYRPIVLIGAPRIGRHTLTKVLVDSNLSVFEKVLPHTSRKPKPGEVEGREYHFVTKEEFESDLHRDRFLEHSDTKGVYQGLSVSSIKMITEATKVPVISVNPQALKKLHYSGLLPYVIFIASPSLERLHLTRKVVSAKMKKGLPHDSSLFTEIELQQMFESSQLIENQYGHYFDWVIMNDDFQVASDMLKEVVRRVSEEPQWVPNLPNQFY